MPERRGVLAHHQRHLRRRSLTSATRKHRVNSTSDRSPTSLEEPRRQELLPVKARAAGGVEGAGAPGGARRSVPGFEVVRSVATGCRGAVRAARESRRARRPSIKPRTGAQPARAGVKPNSAGCWLRSTGSFECNGRRSARPFGVSPWGARRQPMSAPQRRFRRQKRSEFHDLTRCTSKRSGAGSNALCSVYLLQRSSCRWLR